ncbi:MAG: hypothetical protein ACKO2R_00090 [Actinomycetota bacterium]
MSTKTNIGLVDTDELTRVFDSIWMLRMEGKNTPGVVVYCEGGRRKWSITSDKLSILITGDTADFVGAYRLPLTIVANAGRQNAANGAVTFTIENDTITAESARGRQTVSCSSTPAPTAQRVAVNRSRASATLSGKDLAWTFFSGANMPFEVLMFDDDEERQNPDLFTISIEKGLLMVHSDWTKAKLYPMLGGSVAKTKGRGDVQVNNDFLSVVLNCVDADSEWTISYDPKEPHNIVLESDTQYIVATMTKVPVIELHERAIKLLEREKLDYQVAGNGSIGVRLDGAVVSLDFYQRESNEPLVRLSSIVVRDANESAELLREINAHNCSGSITRCWFDGGTVNLGLELLPDNLHVLPARLRQLDSDVRRMKGVLDPFAAKAALPPKKRRHRKTKTEKQPEVWD